jgi:hypothetical protein
MTTEASIQADAFVYISCYLAANNASWSISNLPRCSDATFTFDSRHVERPQDPLIVIHTWAYGFAQPTTEQLLAISPETHATQRKYITALTTKRDVIVTTNQVRALSMLPNMTMEEIVALVE